MADTIGKQDLITRISQHSGLPSKQVEKTVNALIDTVTQSIEQGGEVRLTGFGTFKVVNRAARKGRHPRTGEEMQIPGASRPTFTPGSKLVEAARKATGDRGTRRAA